MLKRKTTLLSLVVMLIVTLICSVLSITASAEGGSGAIEKGATRVTSHIDPAGPYITDDSDPSYKYIFLTLGNVDYGRSNSNINVTASFDNLNYDDYISIDGKTLREIYNELDTEQKSEFICEINALTRWGCFSLRIPTVTDYRDIHKIVIAEGCQFPAQNGTDYYTASTEYYYSDVMEEKGTTKITDHRDYVYVDYTQFYLNLTDNDYGFGDAYANISTDGCKLEQLNLLDKILVDGKALREYSSDPSDFEFQINKRQRYATLGFCVPGIANIDDIITFEVLEGCQLPAYNGGGLGAFYYTVSKTYFYINQDMENGYDIPDNAVAITETDGSITYDIKFNVFVKADCSGEEVDIDCILFNEQTIEDINSEKQYISLQWKSDTRLTLSLIVDKACPALRNADYRYVQNYIVLKAGMNLPEDNYLNKSFRLCVYDDEVVTEFYKIDDPDDYSTNQISGVTFDLDDGTANVAAMIRVTFASAISNENIPAEGDYFVASSEEWKEKTWADKKVWSKKVSRAFMHDGLKSSLLDNVLINGKSIAQWCAMADKASTAKNYAVAVHYGEYGGKVMSIHLTGHSTITKKAIVDSYNDGTLSVSFKPGLKFVTGSMVKEEQKFVFRKSTNSFVPATLDDFAVYYNGSKVENNATIDGYGIIDKNSLYIPNDGNNYYVSFDTKNNNITEVTIYVNKQIVFFFTIKR